MVIDRLIEKIEAYKNPSVVGLDPQLAFIPGAENLNTDEEKAAAILDFNKGIIDAIKDIVPAVKPQIAFYEAFGAAGYAAYWETVRLAKGAGLFVIGDIKRGDIASTAAAYSAGHIAGPNKPDFITINPYLGFDTIEPFLDDCREHDKGLFVLVKTSNKGSGDLQDLRVASADGGGLIYERVGAAVARIGEGFIGECGYSSIGAVVGATKPEQAAALRAALPRTFFLVPGYGAQGGGAQDAAAAFDKNGGGAIVNSSRGIIAAHKSGRYGGDYAEAARQAAIDMRDDLRASVYRR